MTNQEIFFHQINRTDKDQLKIYYKWDVQKRCKAHFNKTLFKNIIKKIF